MTGVSNTWTKEWPFDVIIRRQLRREEVTSSAREDRAEVANSSLIREPNGPDYTPKFKPINRVLALPWQHNNGDAEPVGSCADFPRACRGARLSHDRAISFPIEVVVGKIFYAIPFVEEVVHAEQRANNSGAHPIGSNSIVALEILAVKLSTGIIETITVVRGDAKIEAKRDFTVEQNASGKDPLQWVSGGAADFLARLLKSNDRVADVACANDVFMVERSTTWAALAFEAPMVTWCPSTPMIKVATKE